MKNEGPLLRRPLKYRFTPCLDSLTSPGNSSCVQTRTELLKVRAPLTAPGNRWRHVLRSLRQFPTFPPLLPLKTVIISQWPSRGLCPRGQDILPAQAKVQFLETFQKVEPEQCQAGPTRAAQTALELCGSPPKKMIGIFRIYALKLKKNTETTLSNASFHL